MGVLSATCFEVRRLWRQWALDRGLVDFAVCRVVVLGTGRGDLRAEREDALRCKAFDLAETALNIALEKSREQDEVFAASQMLAYSDNDLSRLAA